MTATNFIKKCLFLVLMCFSFESLAVSGLKVNQVYYCAEDFAIKMSNEEWYLVRKSQVGEKKFDHMLSIALTLLASGKKTGNIFPGAPVEWCGSQNFKPITIISITDES